MNTAFVTSLPCLCTAFIHSRNVHVLLACIFVWIPKMKWLLNAEVSTDQLSSRKVHPSFIHCLTFILSIKASFSLKQPKLHVTSSPYEHPFFSVCHLDFTSNKLANLRGEQRWNICCHVIYNIIKASLIAWSASKSYPCLPPFFFYLLNSQLFHFLGCHSTFYMMSLHLQYKWYPAL